MSQDTALFSVRRPRETLGGLNYNSSIPQPASALKRSNSISNMAHPPFTGNHARSTSGSRMSLAPGRPNQPMFQRSSSGSNLADMGMSTVKRQSTTQMFQSASGGKSYAPPSASSLSAQQGAQRRSSVYSRPSSMGPMGHQSFFQQGPLPAGVPRDPRPLKDRSYQAKIGQELLDYLTQYNFEMEMKHSLTHNTMRSPTQKDFNYIFQWLYHRIDPSYRFQKNIDQEVPPILKQLRYPFEKSITKSQIAAVGGQNWSTFLGMLHWMMQLAQMLDRYDNGVYDDACAEAGVDVSGDRIIFRFLSGAYRDWLQVGEDDDDDDADRLLLPHVELMAAEFGKANEKYLEEMTVLEAEHKSLQEQIEELEKSTPDVAKLDKHFKILETDKGKFEQYNQSIELKVEKYESRIKFLLEEIEKADRELCEAEQEKSELQASVDRQGITIQDIDRMNTERDRLQKTIESTSQRLDEAKKKVADRETDAAHKLEELERAVERYNSLGYQIGLIPSTAPNAKGDDYELALTIHDFGSSSQMHASSQQGGSAGAGGAAAAAAGGGVTDRLLADAAISAPMGYQPSHLLTLDLRGAVRTALLGLKKEINDRRNAAIEQDLNNHDLLDKIKEAIEDKRAEVETLGHRVRAAEEEFEKTKELTTTHANTLTTSIERTEHDLRALRTSLTTSLHTLEQRDLNTRLAHEALVVAANALREELHSAVERCLNDVIRFKVHVQKGLEDLEGFVAGEVEAELEWGAGGGGGGGFGVDGEEEEEEVVVGAGGEGEWGEGGEGEGHGYEGHGMEDEEEEE